MRTSLIAAALGLAAMPASAYVGPGLGLGALAVVAGLALSIIAAFVALVWFPVKRMLKSRKTQSQAPDIAAE